MYLRSCVSLLLIGFSHLTPSLELGAPKFPLDTIYVYLSHLLVTLQSALWDVPHHRQSWIWLGLFSLERTCLPFNMH